MKSRRILSLLAVAALATTVFVGCGNSENSENSENKTNDNSSKEATLKDGNYSKKSEADERGYISSIDIEVKDGKITNVKYDEYNTAGSKLDDADYNKQMKDAKGANIKEAIPALEKALAEKQDVDSVDAVTGATSTSDSFKALAKKALDEAK